MRNNIADILGGVIGAMFVCGGVVCLVVGHFIQPLALIVGGAFLMIGGFLLGWLIGFNDPQGNRP